MDKKLNILIVSYFFPPVMPVGGIRALSWAKYWSELGHNVVVLTSKERSGFIKTAGIEADVPKNIKLIEVDNPLFKKLYKADISNIKTSLGKERRSLISNSIKTIKRNIPVVDYFFDWVYFSKKFIKKYMIENEKFDVVVSTAAPLASHQIGLWIKDKYAVKWVADYRDVAGQEGKAASDNLHGVVRRKILDNFELSSYKNSNMIITVSEGLKALINKRVPNEKTKIIYNGYFHENYEMKTDKSIEWCITYTGTYYDTFDINPLVQALLSLEEEKIPLPKIKFIGNKNPHFESKIKAIKNIEIEYFSNLNMKEVAYIQQQSAVLLFLDERNSVGVLKTKSFEYLAARRPIVALINPDGEMSSKIMKHKKNYCVGFNSQEIYVFLKYVFSNLNNKLDESEFIDEKELYFYSRKNQALELLDEIYKITKVK